MKKNIKKNINSVEERPLFKTTTVINEKEFKKFQKFYLNKFNNNIIPIIIMVILAGSAIYLNAIKDNFYVVCLVIAFIVIYPIVLALTLNIQIKKMYKTNKRINMLEETLTFFEDHLESRSENNHCKIKYKDLFKVCETKENLYIFVNSNQAFIIIKSFLSDIEEFRSFIKEHITYKKYR